MPYDVLLTAHAQSDLDELYDTVAGHDGPRQAAHVLDRIERALESLSTFPERGSHPKELLDLGIREYRQIFFKPYRLIYRTRERRVYVYVAVDGRRDMQSLLARRLLGA